MPGRGHPDEVSGRRDRESPAGRTIEHIVPRHARSRRRRPHPAVTSSAPMGEPCSGSPLSAIAADLLRLETGIARRHGREAPHRTPPVAATESPPRPPRRRHRHRRRSQHDPHPTTRGAPTWPTSIDGGWYWSGTRCSSPPPGEAACSAGSSSTHTTRSSGTGTEVHRFTHRWERHAAPRLPPRRRSDGYAVPRQRSGRRTRWLAPSRRLAGRRPRLPTSGLRDLRAIGGTGMTSDNRPPGRRLLMRWLGWVGPGLALGVLVLAWCSPSTQASATSTPRAWSA